MREPAGQLFRLLSFSPSIRLGVLGVVAVAGRVTCQTAVPLVVGFIIDDILRIGDATQLTAACVLLGALTIGSTVAREMHAISLSAWGEGALSSLRREMLSHLQRSPTYLFERQRSGSLAALFTTDAQGAARLIDPLFGHAILSVLQLGAILVILSVEYGSLVFLAFAFLPLYMSLPTIFSKPARKAARRAADVLAEMGAGVQESIDGIRELKAFGQQRWNSRRLERTFLENRRQSVRAAAFSSLYAVSAVTYGFTMAFVYWFGGRQVLAGSLTIGQLVALVWYLNLLGSPATKLVGVYGKGQRALASAQRIFEFLDRPAEPDRPGAGAVPRGPVAVELEDVWFTYPGKDRPALQAVSLRLEPGERVAVVGPSGGGKSTLFKLLLRFHEPNFGRILLEGAAVHDYSLESIRQTIGFVPQEPALLSVTIAENIGFGRREAGMEEIEAAARAAQAHEFILSLPQGYASLAGERGTFLSVGQKQRIAIARLFLRNPGLVLLDEATSALDAESEFRVREALDHLRAGRTSLTITHRLSSAIGADRILVFEEGALVASGTHPSLVEDCPVYRRLVSHYFTPEKEMEMAL